ELAVPTTPLPHLCADDPVLPLPTRFAKPLAVLFFVGVERRSIEVAVTDLQRRIDRLYAYIVFQCHGAQTDLRNAGTMGFNHLHHSLLERVCWDRRRAVENAPTRSRCQPGSLDRRSVRQGAAKDLRNISCCVYFHNTLGSKLLRPVLTLE